MPKKSRGTIRAKGSCPICKEKFTEIKGIGYICLEHKTVPEKVWVDFPWEGERIRIFSDKTGKPLDTYSRAEEVLKHLHYELTNHTFDPKKYINAEAQTFWVNNLLDRFKKQRIPTLAPSYTAAFSLRVDIAAGYFKDQDVRDIRKIDLINYKEYLEGTCIWKPKTLKNAMDVFKTFMGWVKNDLELIANVPPFPEVDVPVSDFRWLGASDQLKLFELVPDEHKPLIAFLMLHGCRPGEARALKCKDIDLEQGSISISATFSADVYRERRKGKKSKPLVIPIHPEIWDYLADRKRNSHPEAFVFTLPGSGKPYNENKMKRLWDKVRERAGVGKEIRLYDASRHSFASQLVNSGTTLFKVSQLLGHSTTKMSERYSHANLDGLRAELSRVSLKKRESVTRLSPEKTDLTKNP